MKQPPKGIEIKPGVRVGRWTVLDQTAVGGSRQELKRLCRCDCGTERYVLERSLRYGGSISCGCLKTERAREKNAYDLTGKTFGDLTVMCQTSNENHKSNGLRWLCMCSCGNTYETFGTLLVQGRRTHCGCRDDLKHYAYSDIAGKRFNRLTALYPTDQRTEAGGRMWHCRCDCGNELDVSYNTLVYTNQMSCGCQKKEHDQILQTFLTRVDGTSIDILRSKKIPTSNTTGVRGVYRSRGKYIAKLVLQKKQYHLGTYRTLEAAAQARREADETIDREILQHYDQWLLRAQTDPAWAESNPVRYDVSIQNGVLVIDAEPALREIMEPAPDPPEPITDLQALRQGHRAREAREQTRRRCSYSDDHTQPPAKALAPQTKTEETPAWPNDCPSRTEAAGADNAAPNAAAKAAENGALSGVLQSTSAR